MGSNEILQLPRVGRKTVFRYVRANDDLSCSSKDQFKQYLAILATRGLKTKAFTDTVIETAMEKANKILADCEKLSINIIGYFDKEYPAKIKESLDPPVVLYAKGNIEILNNDCSIAIIGTRGPTEYGKSAAYKLGQIFARDNFVVVSGLAIGCDEYGHKGCLSVDGKTIAVMGEGLDTIYPAQNKELAQEILDKGGCLLSEYPPYTRMFKNNFVDRDRLQSALSDTVIVIETGVAGGTMHTVSYALEYGRKIACLRHPEKYQAHENVAGNVKLLSEGAIGLGSDQDIDELKKQIVSNPVKRGDGSELEGQLTLDFL